MLYEGGNALAAIGSRTAGMPELSHGAATARCTAKSRRLAAQLEVVYKDGRRATFSTDGSWKWAFGPITYSDIYHGENYDARRGLGELGRKPASTTPPSSR